MPFEVPVDDVDTEKMGGFDKVAPGSYHLEITDVDEDGGDKGEMVVKFEVLRGTVSNQEGKELVIYFKKEMRGFPLRLIHSFAVACGMTTRQTIEQQKTNGTPPTYDFNPCIGRQVCANFEANEYNGKISTRLIWDEIYHPTDKRANHIPLLMAKIQKAGIKLPDGRNPDGAVQVAKPAAKPASGAAKPDASKQASNVDALL